MKKSAPARLGAEIGHPEKDGISVKLLAIYWNIICPYVTQLFKAYILAGHHP